MSLGWRRISATLLVSYLVSMLIAWAIVNMRSGSEQPESEKPSQNINSASAPATGVLSGSAQNSGGPDWPAPMGNLGTLDDAERVIKFKQEPPLVLPELMVGEVPVSTDSASVPPPPPPVEALPEVSEEDSVSRPIGDVQRDVPPSVAAIDTVNENTGVKPVRKKSEKSEGEDLDLFPIEVKSQTEKASVGSVERVPVDSVEKVLMKKLDSLLTIVNLERLKTAYESAYNRGDQKALAELFERDIQSNERRGLEAVLASYQQLFDITMMREIVIEKLDWSIDKDTARGRGEFQVSVQQRGSTFLSQHRGKIELNVNERASKLLIAKIEYNYYK